MTTPWWGTFDGGRSWRQLGRGHADADKLWTFADGRGRGVGQQSVVDCVEEVPVEPQGDPLAGELGTDLHPAPREIDQAVRGHGAVDFERLLGGDVAHLLYSWHSGWRPGRVGAAEPELVQVFRVQVGRHGLDQLAVDEDLDCVSIGPDMGPLPRPYVTPATSEAPSGLQECPGNIARTCFSRPQARNPLASFSSRATFLRGYSSSDCSAAFFGRAALVRWSVRVVIATASRAARQSMMWELQSRSRRAIATFSSVGAASFSATMRSLHSGEKRRLVGFAAGSSNSAIGPFALVMSGWTSVSCREGNPAYGVLRHRMAREGQKTRRRHSTEIVLVRQAAC